MNEINFNIEDVGEINLSLDVGVKEIKPPLENLEVEPTKEKQIFKHENSYGYDEVVVEPIPDEYIIPDGTLPITENATYDVRKFARVSTSVHPAPNLQDKEITPTKAIQEVISDNEYDGLNKVTVNPIPNEYIIPSGTKDITANGTHNVSEYENVDVNVPIPSDYIKPSGTLEVTENGEYDVKQYEKAVVEVGGSSGGYAPRYISFYNYQGTDLDYELNNLDTSNMTSMNSMFTGCSNLTNITLPNWNVSNVTSMNYMFSSCSNLVNVDMSNLEVNGASFVPFKYMFVSSYKINNVILPKDCSKVRDLSYMFNNTSNLKKVKISGTLTSGAIDLRNMFSGCSNLNSVDMSELNIGVYNLSFCSSMFNYCTNLQFIDLSGISFGSFLSSGNFTNMLLRVPTSCEIIVKDETSKTWFNSNFSTWTNVKTKAEKDAE